MNRFSQFKLSFFAITTLLVLLGAVRSFPIWLLIALFEASVAIGLAYLLCSAIPEPLRERAKRNGFRFDGSHSSRRESRERRALARFRISMMGILTYGVLSCNWIYALAERYDWFEAERWPWLVGFSVFWLAMMVSSICYFYAKIVGEYRTGLESRQLEYESRDVVRNRAPLGSLIPDTPDEMPAYRPSDLASGVAQG